MPELTDDLICHVEIFDYERRFMDDTLMTYSMNENEGSTFVSGLREVLKQHIIKLLKGNDYQETHVDDHVREFAFQSMTADMSRLKVTWNKDIIYHLKIS